jgi:tol-pal system protein YbgF
MARLRIWLLPALSCLLLTSCVYDQEMSYFNNQITSLNRRVSTLEESAGPSKLDALQSSQARLQLEIDQLKTTVSELSGRTEDNEHLVRRIVEQDLSQLDALKARIEELAEKLDRMERMIRQQQQYLGLEPPEEPAPAAEAATPPEAEPAPARPASPPAEGPAAPDEALPSGEIELYEHALGLYREGKHEEARQTFRTFLDRYPKSDRADNAHFWIGEAHMALEEYEQAILAYQNVIKDYPKGNKVANAMLRQAVAFLEIDDKTSARLLLKKIVKEHPGTSEAELARKKLEAL